MSSPQGSVRLRRVACNEVEIGDILLFSNNSECVKEPSALVSTVIAVPEFNGESYVVSHNTLSGRVIAWRLANHPDYDWKGQAGALCNIFRVVEERFECRYLNNKAYVVTSVVDRHTETKVAEFYGASLQDEAEALCARLNQKDIK